MGERTQLERLPWSLASFDRVRDVPFGNAATRIVSSENMKSHFTCTKLFHTHLVVKGRVTLITWNSDKSPSLEFASKASKFDDVAIKVSGQYLFDKLVPIKNTKGPSVRQPCNGVYIGLVRENLIELWECNQGVVRNKLVAKVSKARRRADTMQPKSY